MTSANPEPECADNSDGARELPGHLPRHLAGPLLFSVALHGIVLMAFARSLFAPGAAETPVERTAMRVALVVRPRPAVEPPAFDKELPRSPALPSGEEAEPGAVDEPATQEAPTPDVPTRTAPTDVARPATVAGGEEADADSTAADPDASAAPWTPARIRAAIDTTAREQRSDNTASWLNDCLLEQAERGTRDCTRYREEPDLASDSARAGHAAAEGAFAAITRPQVQARLSREFQRKYEGLEELMEAGGQVGALATHHYYLNLEYFRYLNGNGPDPLMYRMQNFGFRTGIPGMAAPSLYLRGGVVFRCKKMPCVYEFNGFVIEPPEPEADANAFRVVPVVPGSQATRIPAQSITP